MRKRFLAQWKTLYSLPLSLKFWSVLSLFVLGVLVVACGNATSNANPGDPPVTVTIDLNNNTISPTPPVPAYQCGAWATQSTPPMGTAAVAVYAKFVQNVKTNPNDASDVGNPQGVAGATAIATVLWPDGAQSQLSGITGADGLVAFAVPTGGRADAMNRITFVTVQFAKDGVPPCTVDQTRAAFFTLVPPTAGTPTGKKPK
jgi:hypothetical protein